MILWLKFRQSFFYAFESDSYWFRRRKGLIILRKYLKIPVTVLRRANPKTWCVKTWFVQKRVLFKKGNQLINRVNLTLIIFIFDVNIGVVVHTRGLSLHTSRRNPSHDLTDFFWSSYSFFYFKKLLGNSLWVLVALRLKRE